MSRVISFGAKGDGENDDTGAIQHAIEAGDGVLELTPGTFRITRPLVLDLTKRGLQGVRGDSGTARLLMDGPGPAIRIVGNHQGTADPESVREHVWTHERFPTIHGLEIVGKHAEADGIELVRTMQATVSEVLIRKCRFGVHLVERNRNFLLANSHIYDNSHYGVFLDNVNLHQIIVVGNHISYNKRAGLMSLNGDVHNLEITGNDIEYNFDESLEGCADLRFEATEGTISEVTIAGNTIQAKPSPGGANVRITGGPGALMNARIFSIAGNVIGSQRVSLHMRHAQRVAVSGNTIYDGSDLSVQAEHCEGLAFGSNTYGWSYQPERRIKDGLRFEDCAVGSVIGQMIKDCLAGESPRGGAISLVRCKDMTVANCQVRDPAVRGVWLEDCTRCQVVGNTITDEHEPKRMRTAIVAAGTTRFNLVENNIVTRGLEGDIQADAGVARTNGNLVTG